MKDKSKFIMVVYPFIIGLLITSCLTEKKPEIIVLDPIDSIGVLPDSSFLSSVYSMSFKGSNLFVSDYRNQRIIEFSKNKSEIYTYGKYGRGPGELITSGFISIKEDSLYVIDEFSSRLNIYDLNKKKYIKNYDLSKYSIRNSNFTLANDNVFFISTPDADLPISKFQGNKLKRTFGHWVYNHELKHKGRSVKRIFSLRQKYIMAVSQSEPFYEVFDKEGGLLCKINFGYFNFINKRYKLAESEYKKDTRNRKSILLLNDAYLSKDLLYLLFITNDNNSVKDIKSNIVCVLKIAADFSISKKEVYQLTNTLTYFSAICIDGNEILSYSPITNKIYTFKVK